MEWFFDGIGTEIIGLILGLIIGGTAGYRIGIKKSTTKQNQKARNNAAQIQIGKNYNGK